VLCIGWLPTIIAFRRKSKDRKKIAIGQALSIPVGNFLQSANHSGSETAMFILVAAGLFWLAMLVWSLQSKKQEQAT